MNNLKQIGISFSNYVSIYHVFPQDYTGNGYSAHVCILPYAEQANLYNTINFSVLSNDTDDLKNLTATKVRVSLYVCPSDSNQDERPRTNYAGNCGYGYDNAGHASNGIFVHPFSRTIVGYASISDGASQTALFSEWLVGANSHRERDPIRSSFFTAPALREASGFNQFVDLCTNIIPSVTRADGSGKGKNLFHGDLMSTLYNHNITPNGHSCLNGGLIQQGAWTTSSGHGSIHVLFADGHVGAAQEQISQAVWRALGSRAGGEIVSQP